jgi:predicted N-acetyltransferase YhbS
MMAVRAEAPGEENAIRRLNELAFEGRTEADLIDALRGSEAWLPEFSLVADDGAGIVGHVLFSVVRLDTGAELLSLGFEPARAYDVETPYEAPDEAWMALPLPRYDEGVRGTVVYPPAWSGV